MLRNTYYYGEFEYPRKSGTQYKGNHEPIISKEPSIKACGITERILAMTDRGEFDNLEPTERLFKKNEDYL